MYNNNTMRILLLSAHVTGSETPKTYNTNIGTTNTPYFYYYNHRQHHHIIHMEKSSLRNTITIITLCTYIYSIIVQKFRPARCYVPPLVVISTSTRPMPPPPARIAYTIRLFDPKNDFRKRENWTLAISFHTS